jgi:glucose-6-phosphate isomerase
VIRALILSNDLESLGKWYRQLMGESLGKEFDLKGRQIFIGITPTYCIGSTDLHSMGQQYLGGPFDTFTTFVSIKKL